MVAEELAVEDKEETPKSGGHEPASDGEHKHAAPRDEYANSLERAVAHCLPFFKFFHDERERYWSFTGRISRMTARAELNSAKGTVTLIVADDIANEVIEDWEIEVKIIGEKWRRRLRGAVGEVLALAYFRPFCLSCHNSMRIRRRTSDGAQFFGCMSYPKCQCTLGIVKHDIDRG